MFIIHFCVKVGEENGIKSVNALETRYIDVIEDVSSMILIGNVFDIHLEYVDVFSIQDLSLDG